MLYEVKKFVSCNIFSETMDEYIYIYVFIDGINIMFTTKIEKEEDWWNNELIKFDRKINPFLVNDSQ